MKKLLLIALFTVLTATLGHAANDEIVVDGVLYEWYENSITHDYGYVATGWDEVTPIQSLHIRGEVGGYQVYGIAAQAFQDNQDIVYLTIDEGIGYIGEDAFYGCSNIEVAILPEGLITIEEGAFAYCTSLTEFVVPSTVRDIQARAFMGCTGVTDVYFLMTDATELDKFVWWDGWYQNIPGEYESSDPHGGIEFNKSRKLYEGDDPRIEHDPVNGTVVHIPAGTYDIYDDSGKLEAWLFEEEPVDKCYPLWWIVNYGVVGREYTVSDALAAVYVDVDDGLYAKDDNHWLTPDRAYPGETDYIKTTELMQTLGNEYDQSNWVVLTGIEDPTTYKNFFIAGGSITGTLINKKNPVIEVSEQATLEKDGGITGFNPNVYIPASFMDRTQRGTNGKTYAFVRPKPQELISVKWAIYNGDDECFYLPKPNEDLNINTIGLAGGVAACYDLYERPPAPTPQNGGGYEFNAINRVIETQQEDKSPSVLKDYTAYTPYFDGGISNTFIVYPLNLPSTPTAINEIDSPSQQASGNWYTIDGRCLGNSRPTAPGLYLNNRRKVIVTQ